MKPNFTFEIKLVCNKVSGLQRKQVHIINLIITDVLFSRSIYVRLIPDTTAPVSADSGGWLQLAVDSMFRIVTAVAFHVRLLLLTLLITPAIPPGAQHGGNRVRRKLFNSVTLILR